MEMERTCARTAANDIPRGSARSSCTPAAPPPALAGRVGGSCRLRRSRSRTPLRKRVAREAAEPPAEEADAAEEDAASASVPAPEGSSDRWSQPESISAGGVAPADGADRRR